MNGGDDKKKNKMIGINPWRHVSLLSQPSIYSVFSSIHVDIFHHIKYSDRLAETSN